MMVWHTIQTMRYHFTGRSSHHSRNSFRSMHSYTMVSVGHITGGDVVGGGVVVVGGGSDDGHSGGGVVVGALSVVLSIVVVSLVVLTIVLTIIAIIMVIILSTVGGASRSNWTMGRDNPAGALEDHFIPMVGCGGGYCQQGGGDENLNQTK